MRYYYKLSEFFAPMENDTVAAPLGDGDFKSLPPLLEATPELDKGYNENDLSDLWLLERSAWRANGYGYQPDGTFKDPSEFDTLDEAMEEYHQQFCDAVADHLYF